MATTTTVPAASDGRIPGGVTAHHTISIEPFVDVKRPDVHAAVVERYCGKLICVCCRDVDLREGATLEQVAHRYAETYEADYLPAVVPVEVTA